MLLQQESVSATLRKAAGEAADTIHPASQGVLHCGFCLSPGLQQHLELLSGQKIGRAGGKSSGSVWRGKGLVARTQLLSKAQQRGEDHTPVLLSSAFLSTKQRSSPLLHIPLQLSCELNQVNALEGHCPSHCPQGFAGHSTQARAVCVCWGVFLLFSE